MGATNRLTQKEQKNRKMEDNNSFSLVDPKVYLRIHVPSFRPVSLPLKHLHELYNSDLLQPCSCYKRNDSSQSRPAPLRISVLDLGCGPALTHAIVAAPYASEIVMADFAEQHRKEIQKWLNNDRDAHDWSPMLTHIVTQVEGRCAEEITERVAALKRAIKAVVHCNVTQDSVIPVPEYMKEYDIVQTFFCLESACPDRKQYKSALKRVFGLVKPGGKLVYHVLNKQEDPSDPIAQYRIGEVALYDIRISLDFALQSLVEAGFEIIKTIPILRNEPIVSRELCSTTLVVALRPCSSCHIALH